MKKEVKQTSKGRVITLTVERKENYAPKIIDEIMQDDGKIIYLLENGNTQPKELYLNLWGKPKGIVLPKNTKSKSLDPRSNYY